ncbi:hypothetical protein RF11_00237 [Thelohanellus kitauei]|uniref:Uncharacterized protein n=1 Tax=Thelohanellus kitauei TaxID=669202 RepID=A0A0C2NL59_THEKT|nr:hypothetical protein RF11_00237 [Thelohanellus kitauei]
MVKQEFIDVILGRVCNQFVFGSCRDSTSSMLLKLLLDVLALNSLTHCFKSHKNQIFSFKTYKSKSNHPMYKFSESFLRTIDYPLINELRKAKWYYSIQNTDKSTKIAPQIKSGIIFRDLR